VASRPRGSAAEFSAPAATSTNLSPAKAGFIAELCIPEDADGARRVRLELVDQLKQQRLFSKVDLVSGDLLRNLADSKVVVPDRDFVLALDFAATEFQQPLPPRKPPAGTPARAATRRGLRPPSTPLESGENPSPIAP